MPVLPAPDRHRGDGELSCREEEVVANKGYAGVLRKKWESCWVLDNLC